MDSATGLTQSPRSCSKPSTPSPETGGGGHAIQRVLMTTDAVGGVWQYSIELAAGLAKHDVQVTLAVIGPAPTREQAAAARHIPGLQLHHRNLKLEWMEDPWEDVAAAGDWLHDLAEATGPDIIHLNGYAHAALDWASPVLVVGHSCVGSWFRAVRGCEAPAEWQPYREKVRAGLAGADCVAAPTQAMLSELSRYGTELRHTRVIPNARDPKRFHRGQKEAFVLTAGRLWDPAKNIALLDRIAPRLPVDIYAAGPDATADAGTTDFGNLNLLGRLDSRALSEWMGRAALYASPARYEPFGLTALEAALSGCALVLGDIPSLREVWGPAATFVDPDDEDEWIHVLNALAKDADQRHLKAEQAHRRAQQYTPERMTKAYVHLYRNLCTPARVPAISEGRID